jgi:hypothetical protein
MSAYWVSQAVYVAAKLGIADLLADGAQNAEQLAVSTDTHAESLYRLLRALASVGIFEEDHNHCFALTPLADQLRSDLEGSQRSLVLMMGEEHYRTWSDLLYSVQTGEVAFDKSYGMPIFEYLSQHPDKGQIFDEAMTGIHGHETEQVLEAYDFAGIQTLADIGGGNGSKIATILERNPHMQGILFDLPPVIQRALPDLEARGLSDRCQAVGGSFFESVPDGADAYLLRHIIHDWDDENAITILTKCREAMHQDSKLLVIESVIPPGNDPFFGKFLDLTMLLIPGGKERTVQEYRQLFEDAGLMLSRVVPTSGEISVIEGERRYPQELP